MCACLHEGSIPGRRGRLVCLPWSPAVKGEGLLPHTLGSTVMLIGEVRKRPFGVISMGSPRPPVWGSEAGHLFLCIKAMPCPFSGSGGVSVWACAGGSELLSSSVSVPVSQQGQWARCGSSPFPPPGLLCRVGCGVQALGRVAALPSQGEALGGWVHPARTWVRVPAPHSHTSQRPRPWMNVGKLERLAEGGKLRAHLMERPPRSPAVVRPPWGQRLCGGLTSPAALGPP